MIKKFLKQTIIFYIYHYIKKFLVKPKSQSDESEIIKRIVCKFNISDTFIEFGFSRLAREKMEWTSYRR